jgi:hypothetical protein
MLLKAIVAIVLGVAVVVGIVALLGSRLPVQHVATRTITLPVSPDSIYGVITDFAGAPSWRSDLKRVDVAPDSAAAKRRFTEISGSGSMTMEVEQAVPSSRLVTRIVGEGLPFGGAWVYAIVPEGLNTRITITEHGEVYNPIFRFISRYLIGHTGTVETYLRNLGGRFGVEAVPVDAPPVK